MTIKERIKSLGAGLLTTRRVVVKDIKTQKELLSLLGKKTTLGFEIVRVHRPGHDCVILMTHDNDLFMAENLAMIDKATAPVGSPVFAEYIAQTTRSSERLFSGWFSYIDGVSTKELPIGVTVFSLKEFEIYE
jgi:hypothetical protein